MYKDDLNCNILSWDSGDIKTIQREENYDDTNKVPKVKKLVIECRKREEKKNRGNFILEDVVTLNVYHRTVHCQP